MRQKALPSSLHRLSTSKICNIFSAPSTHSLQTRGTAFCTRYLIHPIQGMAGVWGCARQVAGKTANTPTLSICFTVSSTTSIPPHVLISSQTGFVTPDAFLAYVKICEFFTLGLLFKPPSSLLALNCFPNLVRGVVSYCHFAIYFLGTPGLSKVIKETKSYQKLV